MNQKMHILEEYKLAAEKLNKNKEKNRDVDYKLYSSLNSNPDSYFILYKIICESFYNVSLFGEDVFQVINQINIIIFSELKDSEFEEIKKCMSDQSLLNYSEIILELKNKYSSFLRCWEILINPTKETVNDCINNLERLPMKLLCLLKTLISCNNYEVEKIKYLPSYSRLTVDAKNFFSRNQISHEMVSKLCPEYLMRRYSLKKKDIDSIKELLNESNSFLPENPFKDLSARINNALFREDIYNFNILIYRYNNDKLASVRNIGEAALEEIEKAIKKYNEQNK